jgi:hypothetical protein
MDKNILNSEEVSRLIVLVKESYRSTKRGVKYFIEPAPGTLVQATSRVHSIVFGRRGSGKSSLLRKAAADLTIDRRPIAFVDLETFKGHNYPDVLLSVLIQTFKEFENWLRTAAINPSTKTSFWNNLFGKAPERPAFNKKQADELANKLQAQIKELVSILNASDQINVQRIQKLETQNESRADIEGGLNTPIAQAKSQISEKSNLSSGEEIQETYQTHKIDFLHRHILEYQEIFKDMSKISDGDSYLFLDDLYYIKRPDQAKLADYFHRIAKGNNLWLKIGTVRHRSTWYIKGNPAYGLKLGDDAQGINLDLTLENYSTAKRFLVKILQAFVNESGLGDLKKIFVDDAIDRLVLASGGVARDFLGIFDQSITVAKERNDSGENSRSERVGREDVNRATGKYSSTKMDEFKTDILSDEEHISLEDAFKRIKSFCLKFAKSNLFLYESAQEKGLAILQELMDLRLIHKVNSHVTVSKRPGKYFEAYILDVSQYSEIRKKKEFEEIMFWQKDINVRRTGLILEEEFLTSNEPIQELKEVDEKYGDKEKPDHKKKKKDWQMLLFREESSKPKS